MNLKCLIVDDEPIARSVIKNHAKKLKLLDVVGECADAVEANNFLLDNNIDLLFLDIQMPSLNGMEFLKQRTFNFHIVLTTAYSEYAVDSYKFSVTDYLLKPIPFSRFNEAIQKVIELEKSTKKSSMLKQTIFLKADKKIHQIALSDILFFQGYGNYLKVFFKERKPLVVLETINSMLDKLSGHNFMRVHKSYIINLDKIESIEGNFIHIGGQRVTISKTYKDELMKNIT